jgi:hypothetical protein
MTVRTVAGLTAPLQKSSGVDPADLPSKGGLSNKTALARRFKVLRLPRKAGTVSKVTISYRKPCLRSNAGCGRVDGIGPVPQNQVAADRFPLITL